MVAEPVSPEPRWRRLPEERPRQIIEAALDVFSEHGLAAARLEDIAKRAGVSKGTIYLYFPNKEALFCEMIREMVGETITREQASITGSGVTATEQFTHYMRFVWDHTTSPTFEKLHRLVDADLQNYPALLRFFLEEISMRSMSVAAGIIRHGIESGEFREVDPDVAARIHHAAVIKHSVWSARRERIPYLEHLSDNQVFDQLLDFMLHSIARTYAPPTPPPPGSAAPEEGAGE